MKELLEKFTPAIIVGILIILGYSIYMYRKYRREKMELKKQKYPHYKAECPDFWKVVGKNKCQRVEGVGLPNCSPRGHSSMINDIVDFNKEIYTKGKVGRKNKCNWSKECLAPWEGYDHLCI